MNTANQRRSSRICGGGGVLRNWGKGERECVRNSDRDDGDDDGGEGKCKAAKGTPPGSERDSRTEDYSTMRLTPHLPPWVPSLPPLLEHFASRRQLQH